MSSLMHTIYDVVDASVNHSCHNKSKTLRVKLTVTPEPRSHRRETGTGEWKQKQHHTSDIIYYPFEKTLFLYTFQSISLARSATLRLFHCRHFLVLSLPIFLDMPNMLLIQIQINNLNTKCQCFLHSKWHFPKGMGREHCNGAGWM